MKMSTLRLACRLAAKVDLDQVQRALMEEAFGAHDWGGMFFDDQFNLRDLAQKRRELKRSTSAKAERSAPTGGVDPLDRARPAHGAGHPVARDVDIGDLALCLMVLPGLVATGSQTLVAALSAAQPVVAVRGNVRGFERRFTGLLESLVRTKRRPLRVVHLDDPSELAQKHRIKTTEIVGLQIGSEALDGATPAQIRRCLMTAMRTQTPIVVTSEQPGTDFPVHIASALDLTIDAAPLNWPMLAELIDAKTGIDADRVLAAPSNHAIDLTRLSLDDRALAIRPGRKLEVILMTLAQLAAAPADEPSDDDSNAKNRKTTSSSRNRNGTAGTGSVRIDPQPLPAAVTPETRTPAITDPSNRVPASDCKVGPADAGNGGAAAATPSVGVPDGTAEECGNGDTTDAGNGGQADAIPPGPDGKPSEAPRGRAADATGVEHNGPALPTPELASASMTDADVAVTPVPASAKAAVRPTTPRARSTPVVSVETLAGYGKARDWALDLKADLAAWKAGTIPWSDLSSKLLLSGPPGTGKTTFARALGNTLQLPVFATSVATWLEASHLGDVLKRMRDCFEEAGQAKPCILFIDEIDGIGKRQDDSREYADYWNALVNRMLELMDGAIRSEGIIVLGATNRPDDIEPALRRSGRLETHIVIPKPDMQALEGILAFHLGDDLADIVASAPDRPQMEAVARTSTSNVGEDRHEQAAQASVRSSSARTLSVRSAAHTSDRVGEACETEKVTTLDDDGIDGATATPSSSATPTPAAVAETPRKRRRTIRAKAIDIGDVDDHALTGPLAAAPAAPAPGPETDAERARRVLRLLARAASSLTGADVERIVREERQRCRRGGATMAFDPLRAALRDGRSDLPADLRRQVAIHEAGHAVVFRALALGEQGEMTIDAPEGGVTMTAIAPMTIQSEIRLMDLLAMKLAGRAAETVCGLAPHAGSGGGVGTDLQVATALALELECRAGFNADAPLLHIEPGNTSMIHLARPDAYRKANARLEQAYEMARHLIDRHRDAHGALVEALLVLGTLDGAEVDAILKVRMKRTE